MIYYEAFQTKEGKILYALFIVITLILFVIDRFIDKKKKKDLWELWPGVGADIDKCDPWVNEV